MECMVSENKLSLVLRILYWKESRQTQNIVDSESAIHC